MSNNFETFPPKPLGVSKQRVAEFAAQLREETEQETVEYCNLDHLFAHFLGRVHMDGGVSIGIDGESGEASLIVHGNMDFDAYLNPIASFERNRFSKAHELGHYYLHYHLPQRDDSLANSGYVKSNIRDGRKMVAWRSFEQEPYEWEANWFAAGLLMPASLFKSRCDELGDIAKVARQFGVSQQAASVRARELSIEI